MNEWIQLRILSVTVPSPFVSERWEGAWGHRGERLNLTFLRLFLLDPLAGLCHQTAVFKNRAVCISRHTCAHTCTPHRYTTHVWEACTVYRHARETSVYMYAHMCVHVSVCMYISGREKAGTGVEQRTCVFAPMTKPGHRYFFQPPVPFLVSQTQAPCVTAHVHGMCPHRDVGRAQGGHPHAR